MIFDISSIVTNNILFNLKQGSTLEMAFEMLKMPYIIEKDYKNDITFLIINDVQLCFNSKIFSFGVIKFWSSTEVICLDNKIDKRTKLESIRKILDLSNIDYSETEVFKNDQLNLELENEAIFFFDFNENNYCLTKIQWGGKL